MTATSLYQRLKGLTGNWSARSALAVRISHPRLSVSSRSKRSPPLIMTTKLEVVIRKIGSGCSEAEQNNDRSFTERRIETHTF